MEPWREELYHSELYHYGVKGMKWKNRKRSLIGNMIGRTARTAARKTQLVSDAGYLDNDADELKFSRNRTRKELAKYSAARSKEERAKINNELYRTYGKTYPDMIKQQKNDLRLESKLRNKAKRKRELARRF